MRSVRVLAVLVAACAVVPVVANERQMREATRQFRAKSYRQTVTTLEGLLRQEPGVAEAHRLLGHAYFALGETDSARQAYGQALAHGLLTRDVVVRLISMERNAGHDASVLNLLRLAQQLEPQDPDILANLGQTAAGLGLEHEATAALQQLLSSRPLHTDAFALLGNLHLTAGRRGQALTAFRAAYALGRRSAELAQTIADLSFQLEDFPGADVWYGRAAALDGAPGAGLLLSHAQVLFALEDNEQAESLAQRAAAAASDEEKPAAAQAHLLLGQIAESRSDGEAALRHWQQALALDSSLVEVREYLAAYHFQAGKFSEALPHYEARVASDPRDADARFSVALCLLELERSGDVQRHIEKYVEYQGLDDKARQLIRALASLRRGG